MSRQPTRSSIVNVLPGPVAIHPEVQAAFSNRPVSHRADYFLADMQQVKERLCELVNGRYVELFVGSGSLANDVIGAQLSLLNGPGCVLENGEFGRRLAAQAVRYRLSFSHIKEEWGRPFNYDQIEALLDEQGKVKWLWCVHCETSTGVLNNLSRLIAMCRQRGIKLCVDCISSIGVTPVDLAGVYLASGVSGKGLASFPGLAMVFYHQPVEPAPTAIPSYLDLGYYASKQGVPFTSSSNLLYALQAALGRMQLRKRLPAIKDLSDWLRLELEREGHTIVAGKEVSSPAVISLAPAPGISTLPLGDWLEEQGYLLSYKSEYLVARNWIQICLFGECRQEEIAALVPLLKMEQK